jgi:hypothetical protein
MAVSEKMLGLAGAGLSMAYNEYSQRQAEQRAQANYVKNQKMNFQMAQQAERNSAMNQKFGLIQAGLNPALATEGRFSGVAGASAPLQTAQGQKIDPLTANQLANDATQRDLLKAKTENQEIINTRMNDEDSTFDLNLRTWIDGQLKRQDISEDYRKMLESMRGNVAPYSKGSFDGLSASIELTPKMYEQIERKVNAEYQTKILDVKNSLKSYEWVARMDMAQFEKLVADTAQIQMNTALLSAKTGLTQHEANKLNAETSKLVAETMAISDGNIVELWTQGEWKKLIAHYGDTFISSAIDVVGVAGKAKMAHKATKGLIESLNKGSQNAQKYASPKFSTHSESWIDKRGHHHKKFSRQ